MLKVMNSFKAGLYRRMKLLQSQAVDAHPLWIFIGCLLLAYALAEASRAMFDAPWMYAFGMSIEIVGILFVVAEIASVRKLVGKPGFVTATIAWIARFRDFILKPKPIHGSLNATAGGFDLMFGRARLTHGTRSKKLTDRVEALENNLGQVYKELDQFYGLIDDVKKHAATLIDEKTDLLAGKIESQGKLLADIAAGDSATKLVGVSLVLLGFAVQNFPRTWAPAPLF